MTRRQKTTARAAARSRSARKAAAAPAPATALTAKQQRFVTEYLVDLNATAAAKRSGYSARSAEQQGYENLRKPEIAVAIAAGKAAQLANADLSAARVLEELRRLAFLDIRGLFDADGNLVDPTAWTAEQGSAVAALEVVIKNTEAGDGQTDVVHKVKLWDKPRALELLAKHFRLLVDRVQVENDEDVIARLHRGRERARTRALAAQQAGSER